MDFTLNDEQNEIKEAIARLCRDFSGDYWISRDKDAEFPRAFYDAIAKDGWLGIAMPEAYGGSGLGITEAAIMMGAVAESGGAMSAASAIHGPIFGMEPVARFGSEDQKQRMIPPILSGEQTMCFAVTEPNVGLDTTKIKTHARPVEGGYRVNGEKVWITNAHHADQIMLLARTTPLEEVKRKTEGLSLFFTRIDRKTVETHIIPKMGRHSVGCNTVFFNDFDIPTEDRIGEEGAGFKMILQGFNPERILLASEAVGLGKAAISIASDYAKERVVFDRPIGQNQAIQHPLAKCWMQLEAAGLMTLRAATRFDQGLDCGADANAAKYLAAEAGFDACQNAMMSMGGMGYAKEYHVERYLREVMVPRIAPVSPQMILNYISEHVLELPRSY